MLSNTVIDNRRQIYAAAGLIILQFVIFKIFYPFPSFFADSYYYIMDAKAGADAGLWPIGYPKFLAMTHKISHSSLLLTGIQYFLLQASTGYLFFTLLSIFQPAKWVTHSFLAIWAFNPLYLYLSNIVASDALFTSLSILWLTMLIRALHRPGLYYFLLQAVLLALAFTVRYNALYYPLLALPAILACRCPAWQKVTGISVTLILVTGFVLYTREKNYEAAGVRQFTGFSGWQTANNALYMFPYIPTAGLVVEGTEEQLVHRFCRAFFDSLPPGVRITPQQGGWFMHDQWGPLNEYMFYRWNQQPLRSHLQAYHQASGPLRNYGRSLVRHYPLPYFRYYLLPNAWVYLKPPLEQLAQYNIGRNDVLPQAQEWFAYSSPQVYAPPDVIQFYLMSMYPVIFLSLNLYFYVCLPLLAFCGGKSIPQYPHFRILALLAGLLFVNTGFSITASPSVFRYQVFPMIAGLVFLLLMMHAAMPLLKKKGWL